MPSDKDGASDPSWVPSTTAVVAAARNRLFSTSAPSRLTLANRPPGASLGARQANRAKPAPAADLLTPASALLRPLAEYEQAVGGGW